MTAEALPERTVIRATLLIAWIALSGAVLTVACGYLALFANSLNGPWDRIAVTTIALPGMGLYLRNARARIELDGHGVTVVNALRTTRVGWSDVFDVSVDPTGIHVVRSDGSRVTAGLGKTNMPVWPNRRSVADHRLDTIRAYLAAFRAQDAPPAPPLPGTPDQS